MPFCPAAVSRSPPSPVSSLVACPVSSMVACPGCPGGRARSVARKAVHPHETWPPQIDCDLPLGQIIQSWRSVAPIDTGKLPSRSAATRAIRTHPAVAAQIPAVWMILRVPHKYAQQQQRQTSGSR